MGDPLGAVASILGVASFGLKFATTLQTYIETAVDAQESLRDIALDVSATASALKQLHEFVKADEHDRAISNDSGVRQVGRLASQCKQVYTKIVGLIAKAAGIPRDSDGGVSLEALDSLNALSPVRKLIWPFQEPRIKKRQEELGWLKISLLFQLNLVKLAKMVKTTPAGFLIIREGGVPLQATVENLSLRMQAYAKDMALQRKKSKREGKRKQATSRASSDSSIEDLSQSSPLTRRIPIPSPPSPPRFHAPLRRPSLARSDKQKDIRAASSPSKDIEEVSDYNMLDSPTQNNPGTKFNPPHNITTIFVTDDAWAAPIESLGRQAAEDENDIDGNGNSSRQAGPFLKPASRSPSNTVHSPFQNNIAAQASSQDAGIALPTVKSNPNAARNENRNLLTRAVRFLRSKRAPKLSLGALGTLPRKSSLIRTHPQPVRDHESEELEAYLIEDDDLIATRKLPFGQKELVDILRTIKARRGDIWTQYTALTSAQRSRVDAAIEDAKGTSGRARTCLGISPQFGDGQPCLIVIFGLGPPTEPVHVRYGDQYFQLSFEKCRTWDGMDRLIRQTLADMGGLTADINQGRYQLRGLDDHVIPRTTWSSLVRPGLVVFLIVDNTPQMPPPSGHRPTPPILNYMLYENRSAPPPRRESPVVTRSPSPPRRARREEKRVVLESALRRRPSGVDRSRVPEFQRRESLVAPEPIHRVEVSERSVEPPSPRTAARGYSEVGVRRWPSDEGGEDTGARRNLASAMLPEDDVVSGIYKPSVEIIDRRKENYEEVEEEEGEEEADIINFEEEQEIARLGLTNLLREWTNVFNTSPEGKGRE